MSSSQCRNNRNMKKKIQNRKNFTSLANEFLLHNRNNSKMKKQIFFSKLKKCTSPANEFLLHKCRNNRKMKK